ncbi:hypothetical protein vseg_013783 [Gypsophila vaccaria]
MSGYEWVREWVEDEWREKSMEECEEFMMVCWATWEARNKRVFEGTVATGASIINRVLGLGAEMREIHVGNPGEGGLHEDRAWVKPPHGVLKINVDASVREGVGAGIGVVARDSDGGVRWCVVERVREQLDPTEAEARAVGRWLLVFGRRGGPVSIF